MTASKYFPYGEEAVSVPQNDFKLRFTGQERDTYDEGGPADDLDYMHARFRNPLTARFLSLDPRDGIQRTPQSWNRYSYARSNPLKYVDPTGLYTFAKTCSEGDQECKADQEAFEKARQLNLKSLDSAVRAAAAAYGDPGDDNGVTVAFGNPVLNSAGETAVSPQGHQDGSATLLAAVVLRQGLRGIALQGAVGHEGRHILDAQPFVASFHADPNMQFGESWDPTKILSVKQTETNAYGVEQKILAGSGIYGMNYGCPGCVLGTSAKTPADVSRAIERILANPSGPYAGHLDEPQFTGWSEPPRPKE